MTAEGSSLFKKLAGRGGHHRVIRCASGMAICNLHKTASQVVERGSKRGGIWARLRANPTRPALPTLMLLNIRSLENKLDLIHSVGLHSMRQGIVVCLFSLKHGLNDNIPDSAIQLHGLNCYREDRDSSLSGKTRGDGLCVYINKNGVCKCCSNIKTLFIASGVYGCEVSTVLSAAGVHGHCYCCGLHSPVCKR